MFYRDEWELLSGLIVSGSQQTEQITMLVYIFLNAISVAQVGVLTHIQLKAEFLDHRTLSTL